MVGAPRTAPAVDCGGRGPAALGRSHTRFDPDRSDVALPVLTEPGVMGALDLDSTKRVDFGGAGIGSDKPAMFTYSSPA